MKLSEWRRLPSWVPVAIEAGYLDWSDVRPFVLGTPRPPAWVDRDEEERHAQFTFARTVALSVLLLGLALLAAGVR